MAKRKSGSSRRAAVVQAKPKEIIIERRWLAIAALLIALVAAVFWRAASFDFVDWDDNENITGNYLYRPLATSHLGELWTVPYYSAYIPITRLLWAYLAGTMIDVNGSTVADFDPHAYHIANLVVHGLNVILVFLIVRLILRAVALRPRNDANVSHEAPKPQFRQSVIDWAAAVGAAVFALHPLQVEPVSWVTGMKDVLCGFFSLIALYLYLLAFVRERIDTTSKWLIAGASVAFVLAILSKSSAVMLPFIALLLGGIVQPSDASEIKADVRGRFAVLAAWLVAAVPVVLATKHAEDIAGVRIPLVPVWQRPFVMGDTLAFYLGKTVAPIRLGPDYGRTPVWLMHHAWAYAMILIPLALGVTAWALRRRAPWVSAAFGIFVLALLPVTGITPFDFQFFSTVADRYMYFAMLGIALTVAGVIASMPPRASVALGVVVVGCLAVLSIRQAPVWANTKTLFTQGIRVNPSSSVSYLTLGHEKEKAGDLDGALAYYRKAVEFNPESEKARNNLGQALGHKWSTMPNHGPSTMPLLIEAQQHLEESIRLRNNFPDSHANLGNVYYYERRYADALTQYQQALRYEPNNDQCNYMAGMMCARLGNVDQSRTYLQKAADHGFPPAINALKGQ